MRRLIVAFFVLAAIVVLLSPGPLTAAHSETTVAAPAGADTASSTWRILMIVFKETDTDYRGLDGLTRHMRASLTDAEIDAMLTSFTGPVAAAVREWSAGAVQWQIEVRYASRPVTRLSSPDPYNRQWLDPESIQDVIASYSPDGVYDQVMVYWQNGDGSAVIPSWGWGLALPYFPSQVWGYLTVTAVRASYWNPSTADIWSQVWIHEWLHCASSFYASKGYPMPVGDADGGEYHGYAREERGLPGWGAFYSDLMQGRVLEGSQRFGITRDAWLSGSIATEATTTTTQPPTTTTTVPQGQQFSDVSSTHPYYTQIADLAARTISKGFPDGLFHPDASVTRQQFAKMIVKTLGLTVTGSESCLFADVGSGMDATDPFYPGKYVAVCALHGITQGKTQTTFAPYDDISRQQLITMVARSAGLSDPPADYAPPFLPAQFYPEEHYLNARKAAYAHLLDGLQGMGPTYGFLSTATRGEVCALLYNLLHR